MQWLNHQQTPKEVPNRHHSDEASTRRDYSCFESCKMEFQLFGNCCTPWSIVNKLSTRPCSHLPRARTHPPPQFWKLCAQTLTWIGTVVQDRGQVEIIIGRSTIIPCQKLHVTRYYILRESPCRWPHCHRTWCSGRMWRNQNNEDLYRALQVDKKEEWPFCHQCVSLTTIHSRNCWKTFQNESRFVPRSKPISGHFDLPHPFTLRHFTIVGQIRNSIWIF